MEAVNSKGARPLHVAAEHLQAKAVEALLSAGADPAARTDRGGPKAGRSAVHLAALVVPGDGPRARAAAAARAAAGKVLRLLAARGAPLGLRNVLGQTALMLAANYGEAASVAVLLELGSDPHAESDAGYRAVHLAAMNGHADVLRALAGAGARLAAPTRAAWGRNALHLAAERDHAVAAAVCLDAGVDPSARDDLGTMPQHLAAQHGGAAALRVLLRGGAPVDGTCSASRSRALHVAVQGGHLECVRVLIEFGCDLETPNGGGLSAYAVAEICGRPRVLALLRKHGAARGPGGAPSGSQSAGAGQGRRGAGEARRAGGQQGRRDGEAAAAPPRECGHTVAAAAGPHPLRGSEGSAGAAAAAEGTRSARACAACGATQADGARLRACTGCEAAYYCCVEHQRRDWPGHKAACKAARSGGGK